MSLSDIGFNIMNLFKYIFCLKRNNISKVEENNISDNQTSRRKIIKTWGPEEFTSSAGFARSSSPRGNKTTTPCSKSRSTPTQPRKASERCSSERDIATGVAIGIGVGVAISDSTPESNNFSGGGGDFDGGGSSDEY